MAINSKLYYRKKKKNKRITNSKAKHISVISSRCDDVQYLIPFFVFFFKIIHFDLPLLFAGAEETLKHFRTTHSRSNIKIDATICCLRLTPLCQGTKKNEFGGGSSCRQSLQTVSRIGLLCWARNVHKLIYT